MLLNGLRSAQGVAPPIPDHIRFVLIPTNILENMQYFCEIRRKAGCFARASRAFAPRPAAGRSMELLAFVQRLSLEKPEAGLGGRLTFAFCG
jgi:hypothetical protein